MLDQFVDAIALALPGALTWAAADAALRRFAGDPSTRAFRLGTAAGALGAVVLSVLRQTTAVVNRELFSLGLLPLLAAATVVLLSWLWHRGGRTPAPRRLAWLAAALGAMVALAALPDVLLLTVGFVTPGATPFSTEVVLNAAGFVLGLGVVAATTWAAHRAGIGAAPRAVRGATTAVLALAVLGYLTTIVQILLARRLIGLPSPLFAGLVWLLNHEDWFGYAMAAVAVVPILSARRLHSARAGEPSNPAERRRHTADGISRRRFVTLAGLGFGVAVAALTLGRDLAEAEPTLSPPEQLESDTDTVWVPLDRIDDGHLHRFAYHAGHTEVRFIAIRKNARAFGVGLDACEICGPTGYYERSGQVICKLCDVAMNINTIGFKGGCNPIPLEYTIADGRLVVTRAALESHAGVFA
ncbi:MAG: DUF2318 domain-containing protein [Propionicimonas sp.]|nr:DUF2318 domain-containing protein [Propionicimonas sp.]